MSDRIGKFKLSRKALESGNANGFLQLVTPLSVRYDPIEQMYIYLARSAHFDAIEEMEKIPEYVGVATSPTYNFEKVSDE